MIFCSDFHVTPNLVEAVGKLKGALISKPVLRMYSPTALPELHTDASSAGLRLRVKQSELRLHSFELETLAIVIACNDFGHIFSGYNSNS